MRKFFADKKIAFSVICLVAALALAVASVYAWFITNDSVNTDGVDSNIMSSDVLSFEIEYYYATSTNGTDFVIGDKIDPKLDKNKKMQDYTPRPSDNSATTTAVLMKMKLTFSKSGTFTMAAKTNHSDAYNSTDFKKFTTENYLSNVIFFRHLNEDEVDFSQSKFSVETGADRYNFLTKNKTTGQNEYFDGNDDDKKKVSNLSLPDYTVAEEKTGKDNEHNIYYVMDYLSAQINELYSIMLSKFSEANLNTRIDFLHDIVFEIKNKTAT